LSLLAPCYPWRRYPVKPPKPRTLDHTKLRGAVYPVTRFTKAQCAAYVPEKAKEGCKGRLKERIEKVKRMARPKRDEARKLVLPGTWVVLPNGRWELIEAPKRRDKPVPPSFKAEWKRLHKLPAFRPARVKGEVEGASFHWKPNCQHYFGGWEQHRFVRWTPTPRPIVTDFSHFLGQNSFLQHKVEGITPTVRA
jgi:hypothetical protein